MDISPLSSWLNFFFFPLCIDPLYTRSTELDQTNKQKLMLYVSDKKKKKSYPSCIWTRKTIYCTYGQMDFKWINSAPSISRLDLLQQVFICLGLSLVIQFITHSAQLARLIKYKTRILHFPLEMYIRLLIYIQKDLTWK